MYSSLFALLSIAAASPIACAPAAPAAEAPSKFGLIAIHSGSDVQNQGIKLASDGHFSLNGESDVTFELKGDVLYANDKPVELTSGFPIVNPAGSYSLTWGVNDGHLEFNGKSSFAVCLDINNNIAFSGYGAPSNCKNNVEIALRTIETN